MKKLLKIIEKIKNFILYHKIIIGINYHRVGAQNKKNPFEQLHTVSLNYFKIQIKLINFFFNIVSLKDIREREIKCKINFFITFDDVPNISKTAFMWLKKENIAFSICPNVSITENQYNFGDKIRYTINESEKIGAKKKIESLLNEKEKKLLQLHGLRKFYKLYNVDQIGFKKRFNVFFSKELNKNFSKYKDNQYLTWRDIEEISKYSEIVSHGFNHDNFFHLNYDDISHELENSKNKFLEKVNINIKIFALPFGEYNQDLGIIVNELAKKFEYKQVLWVGNQGVVYSGKQKHKIQNLTRVNAPENLFQFIKTIIYSFLNSSVMIHENKNLKKNYDKKFDETFLEKNSELKKITSFENIIRPEKDYSSDEKYIKKIYIENPFRDDLPYNFSIVRNNAINAIHYNLYKNYIINKNFYKILESSAWRKTNSLNSSLSGNLLLRALKTSDIIYSWRPSIYLSKNYSKSKDFYEINNKEFSLEPRYYDLTKFSYNVELYDQCPKNLEHFFNDINDLFYFSIQRSSKLFGWRIDNYPIGDKKYFLLKNGNKPISMLIAQVLGKKVLIVDLMGFENKVNLELLKFVVNFFKKKNVQKINFSSSNKDLINRIESNLSNKHQKFNSYIYIKKLRTKNLIDENKFFNSVSNETYISGDVLIR